MHSHSRPFRLKILALMLDNDWMSTIGQYVILPHYFEAEDEKDISTAILDYRQKYGKSPSDADDLITATSFEYTDVIYDLYEQDYELDYARDAVVQWAKEQAVKEAILSSIDFINAGNLTQVLQMVTEAVSIGDIPETLQYVDLSDIGSWLTPELFTEKIPTGLLHIDRKLEGGISRGEQAWVLGPSNRGKSMVLVNIAYGAASAGVGKNVVIFSHEMHPKVYAKRFAARYMFRFPTRQENLDKYRKHLQQRMQLMMRGRIRILGGRRMKQSEIEHDLRILKEEGFVPDVIIDDYPDLIIPDSRNSQLRHELADIARWFRDIGAEDRFNAVMWGAAQSTRGSFDRYLITEQDVAEDIEKIRIADYVFALCQTKEEHSNNLCRLYAPKVRDGERGFMVDCHHYGKSQAIITIGESKLASAEDD